MGHPAIVAGIEPKTRSFHTQLATGKSLARDDKEGGALP
jgi:hypothetical protein